MSWWTSFWAGVSAFGNWISAQVAQTRVALGAILFIMVGFEIAMMLRASNKEGNGFELTDCLKDPATGKVVMRFVIQIMFAQVFLWSYVLAVLDEHEISQTKLVLMISVLIVSLGVDIAIRVVEWIGKIWMRRAEVPTPPAQGDVTNIAKAGTVIQQPGATP